MEKSIQTVIIQGSSNPMGETNQLVRYLTSRYELGYVDLADYQINHFDYTFKNSNDDFLPLMRDLLTKYETFIFASPVYWYTMSGRHKVFLDRFSDLLKVEKATGRMLRGKNMAVLSCGYDKVLQEGFHMPFQASANYLGMNYIGDVHGWVDGDQISKEVQLKLDQFMTTIDSKFPS